MARTKNGFINFSPSCPCQGEKFKNIIAVICLYALGKYNEKDTMRGDIYAK